MTLAERFIHAWCNVDSRPRGTMSARAVAKFVDPTYTYSDIDNIRVYRFSDGSAAKTRGRGCNFKIYLSQIYSTRTAQ